MSQMTSRPFRRHLVTSVGVANLVFGGLFFAFGVYCLAAGADAVGQLLQVKDDAAKAGAAAGVSVPAEHAQQFNALADLTTKGLSGMILAMVGVVAGCSMLQGAPLLLAGLGVLLRKGWGRVLALVFAVLAGLEGLACLGSAAQGGAFLGTGIVLTAYAVLSFVGLIGRGASDEFSGRARRLSVETMPAEGPHPAPPTAGRSLAVPILAGLLGATTVAAAFLAYLHFMPPAPHSDQPAPGKPIIDVLAGKPVANAPPAKPAEWLPDLMAGAERGQLSRILEAAAKGPVDEKNEQGETALMKAAAKGNVQASALLLTLGAQVNEKDDKGQTPLMLAAANGHGALVDLFLGNEDGSVNFDAVRQQAFLSAPMDLDKIAKDPSKALNLHLPPLDAFKPPHAEVDARDAEGQTAFMKAVVNGHHDAAKTLMLHGANGALTDDEGNNIRHLVARKGSLEIVKHFREDVNSAHVGKYYYPDATNQWVSVEDEDNGQRMQPWMLAAAGGHLEVMKWLLPDSPSKEAINQKNKDGKTALELAAANGYKDVVDYLQPLAGVDVPPMVSPKPPPSVAGSKEPSPLMKAVDAGDLEAVQSLLNADGLSADDRDEEDKTVLMHAAAKGDARIVLLLCEYVGKDKTKLGAKYLEREDKEGRTALIHAAAAGKTAAVEGVLFAVTGEWERGGLNWFTHLSHKDKSGKTALEQADAKADKATADLLRAYAKDNLEVRINAIYYPDRLTALEEASKRGDLPSVEGLLKLGAMDASEKKSAGALGLAVEEGHIAVVRTLLDSFGDDQEARKNYMAVTGNHVVEGQERTLAALNLAKMTKHGEIAAMLKKYGATE